MLKDISDVMHNTARNILEERRRNIQEGADTGKEAKDIISILRESRPRSVLWSLLTNFTVRENERAAPEDKMSENELTGQMT